MWPFLMIVSGADIAGVTMKAAASWAAYRRWLSCLQGALVIPLACTFAFTLLHFWQQPLDFFYHATGFPSDWHCSYANRSEPVCIKND